MQLQGGRLVADRRKGLLRVYEVSNAEKYSCCQTLAAMLMHKTVLLLKHCAPLPDRHRKHVTRNLALYRFGLQVQSYGVTIAWNERTDTGEVLPEMQLHAQRGQASFARVIT